MVISISSFVLRNLGGISVIVPSQMTLRFSNNGINFSLFFAISQLTLHPEVTVESKANTQNQYLI